MNEMIDELKKELELKTMLIELEKAASIHRRGVITLEMIRLNNEIVELESITRDGHPSYIR